MCSERHYATLFRSRALTEYERGNVEYSNGFALVGGAISNLSYGRNPNVYLPDAIELLKELSQSKYLSFEAKRAVDESAALLQNHIEHRNK